MDINFPHIKLEFQLNTYQNPNNIFFTELGNVILFLEEKIRNVPGTFLKGRITMRAYITSWQDILHTTETKTLWYWCEDREIDQGKIISCLKSDTYIYI